MARKRILRWLIIVVCLYLIVTTVQGTLDLWRAGDKLTRREQELAALEAAKKDLLKQKKTVESQGYLEKIARNELGMSKPGEEVIVVPAELLAKTPIASPEAAPNWQKWARLLF